MRFRSQKQVVARRRHVGIMEIEPVGNYAVRLKFDDLHDTGIYSWQYLYCLGRERDALWQAYLDTLAARRSEEHTSELQSLMRISYAVFCLKKKTTPAQQTHTHIK